MTDFPTIEPMLATTSTDPVPLDQLRGYTLDTKYDGIRAIAYWDGKVLSLLSRTGRPMERSFPDLLDNIKLALGTVPVILDGEIVAIDGAFQDVAMREKLTGHHQIAAAANLLPVRFVAFDILRYRTNDLRTMTYRSRRETLENLHMMGLFGTPNWRLSEVSTNPGFYTQIVKDGGEGVIAKKLTSRYTAGRSRAWLKYKSTFTLTCVAVGYEAGNGSRAEFGALLLAMVDGDQVVKVGRVGSGFTEAEWRRMKALMDNPHRLLPIVEIKCLGLTRSGLPRQPIYLGQRNDMTMFDATTDQLKGLPRS